MSRTSHLPSGWPGLDVALGGGWPLGVLAELRGRGRTSLALTAVREAQARQIPTAWVDGSGTFCPATAGLDLAALALVRPAGGTAPDSRAPGSGRDPGAAGSRGPAADTASRALFAADVLLRSQGFGILVLDLPARRVGSAAAWFRLARLTHAARTLLLLLQGAHVLMAGSAARLVLDVSLRIPPAPPWADLPPPGLSVRVTRHRGGSGPAAVELTGPASRCATSAEA